MTSGHARLRRLARREQPERRRRVSSSGAVSALAIMGLVWGSTAAAETAAPYAGMEDRPIAALSAADVAALEAGEGWGLALPAELNGWPGPAHVLEAAEEIGLSSEQRAAVEAVFAAMRREAVAAGADYLLAERALDAAFAEGDPAPEEIAALSAEAGAALGQLRAVHLAAHLETAPLLTRHQRMIYARLRGYAGGGDHDHHGRSGH